MAYFSSFRTVALVWLLFVLAAVPSFAAIWYVTPTGGGTGSTSWANASNDLQAIMDGAGIGDEIWVATGTYTPTYDGNGVQFPAAPRTRCFRLKDGVAIYGGFVGGEGVLNARNFRANPTILSGDFENTPVNTGDDAYHVVVSVNDANSTILDGFFIRNGHAGGVGTQTIESAFTFDNAGGGMLLANSSPTIANCVFEQNLSDNIGGAISIENNSSSPQIESCVFLNDTSVSNGGAIHSLDGDPDIKNCVFTGNTGGPGGAIFLTASGASPTITNSTFYNNTATAFSGAAIMSTSGTTTVVNCIIWGNTNTLGGAVQIDPTTATINVTNSLVQGGYTGAGNIATNPLFANTANLKGGDNYWATDDDGLRPGCGSPALNSGTVAGTLPVYDILGNNRTFGANPDMGAYELPFSAPSPLTVTNFSAAGTTICYGAYGSLSILLSGGVGPNYSYTLTDGTSPISFPGTTIGITYNPQFFASKTYTLTEVHDDAGCVADVSGVAPLAITVTAVDFLSVGVIGSSTICSGGTANLVIDGNYTYNYTFDVAGVNGTGYTGGSAIPVSPTGTTTYTLTSATNTDNGCPAYIGASNSQTITVLSGAGMLYVDSAATGTQTGASWTNAFNSLQSAFTATTLCPGITEIWVAAGTYFPTLDWNGAVPGNTQLQTFNLPNNVQVYGGFNGTESLLSDRDAINNITILSGNIGSPTTNTDNCYHVVVSANDVSATLLDGFTIQDGYASGTGQTIEGVSFTDDRGAGLAAFTTNLTVSNCIFKNNYAGSAGGGVNVENVCAPSFQNCIFTGNSTGGNGGGASVVDANPVFFNCVFTNNTAIGAGAGAYCNGDPTNFPAFTNCTFANNTATGVAGGMYTSFAITSITNCIFSGNTGVTVNGLADQTGSDAIITYCTIQEGFVTNGNIISDPMFFNSADPDGADNKWFTSDDGLQISGCSPAVNAGTAIGAPPGDILGLNHLGNPDMGAYEQTGTPSTLTRLYVDVMNGGLGNGSGDSWVNAYSTLAEALWSIGICNTAATQVWVANGTYLPAYEPDGTTDSPRDFAFVIPDGVTLYGGFTPGQTQLSQRETQNCATFLSGESGDGFNVADNCYHVVYQNGTSSAVLDGFVVEDGYADGSESNGAGIYLGGSATLTVNNCYVTNSQAAAAGGGIYVDGGSLTLKNTEVSGNTAQNGAGIASNGGTVNVANAVIAWNIANGDGAGMHLASTASNIFNTIFYANNSTGYGGGIYTSSTNAFIGNCTFYQNTATLDGGGIYENGGGSNIKNSIFWLNTQSINEITGISNTTTVGYSIVQSATPYAGSNNTLNTDPLFDAGGDPNGGNNFWRTADDGLRLSCTSPGINAGSNAQVPGDFADLDEDGVTAEPSPTDITGATRVQSGTVNLGAYEVTASTGTATLLYVDDDALGTPDGLDWGTAFLTLQDALDAVTCNPVTEIWVAAGTYKPTKDLAGNIPGNQSATFKLPDGVAIYGGFIGTEVSRTQRTAASIAGNPSVLSGDIGGAGYVDDVAFAGQFLTIANNSDNVYHVAVATGLTATTRLDGFTLTGGNAASAGDFLGIVDGHNSGGGLFVFGTGTNLHLENLTFTGNAATNYGGGMFGINGASPAITNCVFDHNFADHGAGLLNETNSSPTIINCTFSDNKAGNAGAGLKNVDNSSPTISNCSITGNYAQYAGGMDNTTGAAPTITDSKFLSNTAGVSGGAVYNNGTSPTFRRTVFANNTAVGGDAGAMVNAGGSPLIETCVFVDNTANTGGGAILHFSGGGGSFGNCTFKGNTATGANAQGAALLVDAGCTASVQNSIFWQNFTPNSTDPNNEEIASYNTDAGAVFLMSNIIRDFPSLANTQDGGGNLASDPKFSNPAVPDGGDGIWANGNDGLAIGGCSPAVDAGVTGPGTDITGANYYDNPTITSTTATDIGAYEAGPTSASIYYVNGGLTTGANSGTTWDDAFRGATALQDALDAACAGAQIWVKAGTYKPSKDGTGTATALNRENTFVVPNGVSIYGGFTGTETAISQRTAASIAANAPILSGDLDGDDGVNFINNGENAYHVLTVFADLHTVDGFTITAGNANNASGNFNGMAYDRGAGLSTYNECITVRNCTFAGNASTGDGGAFCSPNGCATVEDCRFTGNVGANGGGIYGDNLTLNRVIFDNNTATAAGGGIHSLSFGTNVTNCLFADNTAVNGAGAYFSSGPVTITSTTFANNAATLSGGGLYLASGVTATLTNDLLWGNSTTGTAAEIQVFAEVGLIANIAHSLIQDGVPTNVTNGGNNTASDPIFTNPADLDGDDNTLNTNDDGFVPTLCNLLIGTATGGADLAGVTRTGASTPGAYEANGVLSGVVGVVPATNTLVALVNDARNNYRYANVVNVFSSEYGVNWAADKVLGAPDVYPTYSVVAGNQWAPAVDGNVEFLDLNFADPAPINFVDVYETYGPGSVTQIEVYNPGTTLLESVYTATIAPNPANARVLHVTFPLTAFPVERIRITFDMSLADENMIDAVAIGQEDLGYAYSWSSGETTASIVPTSCGTFTATITSGGCSAAPSIPSAFNEIDLSGNATGISDGDASPTAADFTDFGTGVTQRTFTVANTGGSVVTVSSINVSGTDAAYFAVSGATLPVSLIPGTNITFDVMYNPTAAGTHTAVITVNNTDCDEAAYDFAIQATATTGAALAFDGVDDYLTVPANAGYDFASGTVEAWINHTYTVAPAFSPQLVGVRAGFSTRWSYHLLNTLDGVLLWNGTNAYQWPFPATFVADQWYHLAFVENSGMVEAFVNGTSLGSLVAASGPDTGLPLVIGGNVVNSSEYFLGSIDEVRIWNRALCVNEILNNKDCEIATTGTGLVANYHLNGVGTTAADATGNGNTGTLTNFALTGTASNWVATGAVTSGVSCPAFVGPEINVVGNLTNIVDGDVTPDVADHTDFGSGVFTRTFTIQNTTSTTLNISSFNFSGADPGLFTASGTPSTIGGNSSATFTVTYAPISPGMHSAILTIISDDCDEAGYDFALSATNGSRLYVNDNASGLNNGTSWTDAYTSLQSALTAAVAGDSIWVATGMYKPSQEPDGTTDTPREFTFMLPPGVALFGGFAGTEAKLTDRTLAVMNANPTLLSGDIGTGSNTDNTYHVVSIAGSGGVCTLDGFSIQEGNGADGAGINISGGAAPVIKNCIITNNSNTSEGGGVYAGGNPQFFNCVFADNSAGSGGGISVHGAVGFENCVFTGNSATSYGGGFYTYASTLNLTNCVFANNTCPDGSMGYIWDVNFSMKNSIVYNNSGPIFGDSGANSGILTQNLLSASPPPALTNTGQINADPLFADVATPKGPDNTWFTPDDGLRVQCGSPAVNAGTSSGAPALDILGLATNGTKDMGAYEWQGFGVTPTRLYVNQSATGMQLGDTWGDAFKELTTALACEAITPSVTQIWVAAGEYKPTTGTDRAATFALRSGLSLYGDFAGTESFLSQRMPNTPSQAVLSGDLGVTSDPADDVYHVVTASGSSITNSDSLNGFRVKHGNANGAGNDAKGGGMLINGGAYPTVVGCTFDNNLATDGGGVAILNPGTNTAQITELKDCTLTNNTAVSGGGIYAEQMMVKFTGDTAINSNTHTGSCE